MNKLLIELTPMQINEFIDLLEYDIKDIKKSKWISKKDKKRMIKQQYKTLSYLNRKLHA